MNFKTVLGVAATANFATGCFATKMAQTADPLGEGNSEFAISFNTSQIANLGESGAAVTLPNLIPNVHYGVGVSDTIDLYGNVNIAGWYTELGVKYVPIQTENGSLAIAPLLGISPMGIFASARLALPVLYTHKLKSNLSLTVMGEGLYRKRFNSSSGGWASDFEGLYGDTLGVGGGIGLDIRGRALSIRPALSYTYFTAAFDGSEDSLDFGIGQFGLTFVRVGGRTEAQLDRIEEKLDALAE
jgi:hypothetical protein